MLVQDAQAPSLSAYYRVADGCIAHTTVSSGLHRFSRHPTQTGRDFAQQAIGAVAEPSNTAGVTLPREIFGSAEQPTTAEQLAAALAPLLDDDAVSALSTPGRIVTLQHAVARRDGPPTLQTIALHWADTTALLVTPLSPAALTPLLADFFG